MSNRHSWWSVTAFNGDIDLCEGPLPPFVKRILGGRETCPTTGTLHFQGAIQCYPNKPVRMSQIKSWLPTAKLQPAREVEALKKYVMKAETAAGEKTERLNPIVHYPVHEMCLLLASQPASQTDGFWVRANMILAKSPDLAGQLMNPSLRNFYEKTQYTWSAIVLQQTKTDTACGCNKDECEECFLREESIAKRPQND